MNVPSLFAVDLDSFELRVAEGYGFFSLPKLLKISWADHLCFPVTKKHDAVCGLILLDFAAFFDTVFGEILITSFGELDESLRSRGHLVNYKV